MQTKLYVRYNGPLNDVLLSGNGHFVRGEVKEVDYLTGCSLRNDASAREGWEVSEEPFVASEERSVRPRDTGRGKTDE